jgi:putative DNA primase/helicase
MTSDRIDPLAGAEIFAFPSAAKPSQERASRSDANASSQMGGSRANATAASQEGRGGGDDGEDEGDGLDKRLAWKPLTDLGNAERFVERYREHFRYCETIGWLAWDGRRWAHTGAEARLTLAVHKTVRAIQDEAEAFAESEHDFLVDEKKDIWYSDKIKGWGRVSETASRLAAIAKHAAPMLDIPVEALDRDPMRINVMNGTLVVMKREDGDYIECVAHDPQDFITKLAPVVFDRDAECPRYDRFLLRVQPGEAERRFLHQWGGVSATGDTGEQVMTFHYGKGRNGKGVWVNIVAHVLGDYADSIPIESFLDSGRARAGGQATPDLAGLPGVRFLTTSEPKKGAVLDEGLVKLFTGGDRIKARHLNKDFFGFVPQAKLTMQGNYRPKISGTDDGVWSRMILVPWPVFIPKEERDTRLLEELKGEASGILNRLLDGLCDWLDRGLVLPDVVREATQSYRDDSDPLGRFLNDCTRPTLGKRVQAAAMHELFKAWAAANGETQWSAKGLGSALRERGVAHTKSGNVYWIDIELIKTPLDYTDAEGKPLRTARDDGDDEERDGNDGNSYPPYPP